MVSNVTSWSAPKIWSQIPQIANNLRWKSLTDGPVSSNSLKNFRSLTKCNGGRVQNKQLYMWLSYLSKSLVTHHWWNPEENWETRETAMLQPYAKEMKQWATWHFNIVFDINFIRHIGAVNSIVLEGCKYYYYYMGYNVQTSRDYNVHDVISNCQP